MLSRRVNSSTGMKLDIDEQPFACLHVPVDSSSSCDERAFSVRCFYFSVIHFLDILITICIRPTHPVNPIIPQAFQQIVRVTHVTLLHILFYNIAFVNFER